MICFRDKSFCSLSADCAHKNCERNFNEGEFTAAKKWWDGDNPPVCYTDFDAYWGCFKPAVKPKTRKNKVTSST
jgi:hypothetical protein